MSILTDFNPPFLPVSLVRDAYIETGVCEGKSLINAMNAGFKDLRGVELCDRHVMTCGQKLNRDYGFKCTIPEPHQADDGYTLFCDREDDKHIMIRKGSSVRELGRLIGELPLWASVTFYLDAHYPGEHGDEWDKSLGQCPLLGEIARILSFKWLKQPAIIVDDINTFASGEWWATAPAKLDQNQWPTFQQIYDAFSMFSQCGKWTFTINNGILYAWA